MVTVSVTHLPPGEGRSFWVSNNEFATIKTTGKDTGGEFALVELVALPEAEPPPHIHHSMDETYCLLEGELDVLDGDRTFTAKAGSVFYIPKGTLHAWRNATTEPARALLLITPAGFEGVIEEVGRRGTLSSVPPPPPPPTEEDVRRIEELGRKYDTEYPPVPAW
jgi:quercetin dioxygenase-like cupin family protein